LFIFQVAQEILLQEVNIEKVKEDAEEFYRNGTFFCSEAIVASIRKNLAPQMPEELIAAASGFPVGVGRSRCMCGAISGAVICLGYLFGRTQAGDGSRSEKCLKLANELQESFRKNHKGVLCCSVHTKGMDMASGEHKEQCISFTGEMAAKTAEIAARELNIPVTGHGDTK